MYIDASQSNTTTRFTWTLLWAVLLLATGVTPAAGQTLDLLAPSDGTEIGYDQPVPLDWVYSDSTAVNYKIEVAARQSDGTCDMTSVTWSRRQYSERTFDFDTLESYGGSSFDIPGGTLAPGTQYCWHVRVRDGVQFVATSSTGTFELLPSPPTSPSLISPADGEMDVPVDVTYRWSTVSGASQYQYQISSDAAFPSSSTTSGVASETGGTEVTAAPHYFSEGTCEDINGRVVCLEDTSTHLDSMTTYHWRVRSINATDTSAWAGRSFTTVPPATAAPTGLTPADGVEWQVPTLSLSWDPLSAADSFRVELAEANRTGDAPNRYSDWRWSTSTTQTQVSPPTLNRLSRYVWRVTSINAGGATATAWQVFETAPDPPGAVQLAGPANGAVTGRHARVRWTAVSGALSYEIQFAPIADGAGPGAANWSGSAVRSVQHVAPSWGAGAGPGSVLRASVTGLAHDQRYAWRVRGVNPAEVGPWPEARALRTETAPGGRRYYVSDHLRSTRAVVDPAQAADPSSGLSLAAAAAQAVVEARDYYPFGLRMPGRQVQEAQGAPQDYTGHELDETTGFHYAGARYYSSALARWGSVDPLADEIPARSPYEYSFGNPINYYDPTGLIPWPLKKKFDGHGRKEKPDSGFGDRDGSHKGLDMNYKGGGDTDAGAPVLATHDGKVVAVKSYEDGDAGGTRIYIRSANGEVETRYMHLGDTSVEAGDTVTEGQQIGEVGKTAYGSDEGTTAHLHYEVHTKDEEGNLVATDPMDGDKPMDPQSLANPIIDAGFEYDTDTHRWDNSGWVMRLVPIEEDEKQTNE